MRIGIILANQDVTARPYRWVPKHALSRLLADQYSVIQGQRVVSVPAPCLRTNHPRVIRERNTRSVEDRIELNRILNSVAASSDHDRFLKPMLQVTDVQLFTLIGRPSGEGRMDPDCCRAPARFDNLDLSYPTALRTTSEHPHAAMRRECQAARERAVQ